MPKEDIKALKSLKDPDAEAELLKMLVPRSGGDQIPQTGIQDLNMPSYPTSPFAPDPPVLGGPPELSQLFHQLLRRVPALKNEISSVQYGPNADVIGDMVDSAERGGKPFLAQDFGKLNLLGLFGHSGNKIALNPTLHNEPDQMAGTLVHEMAHAAGQGHGNPKGKLRSANRAEQLFYDSKGVEDPDEVMGRQYERITRLLKEP